MLIADRRERIITVRRISSFFSCFNNNYSQRCLSTKSPTIRNVNTPRCKWHTSYHRLFHRAIREGVKDLRAQEVGKGGKVLNSATRIHHREGVMHLWGLPVLRSHCHTLCCCWPVILPDVITIYRVCKMCKESNQFSFYNLTIALRIKSYRALWLPLPEHKSSANLFF